MGESKVNATGSRKQTLQNGFSLKERALLSALVSFALVYTLLFQGAFEIFATNKEELGFRLADFFLPLLLIVIGSALVIGAAVTFARGRVYDILFAVLFWLVIASYLQGNFLNFDLNSLAGDDVGIVAKPWQIVLGIAVWVLLCAGCICAVLLVKKRDWIKTGAVFVLSILLVMQIGSAVVTGIRYQVFGYQPADSEETTDAAASNASEKEPAEALLSDKNLYKIGKKSNIYVFILDRFDVSYYQDIVRKDPDFFDDLDGFTYYRDNVSLYSRTYPAIASMITGIEQDFSQNASDYFKTAYTTSPFLHDLQENGYRIGLYIDNYYTYRDANIFDGIADNFTRTDGYFVNDRPALVGNMMLLSLYRYAPLIAKSYISINSTSFDGVIGYGEGYDEYQLDDAKVYQNLCKEKLSFSASENSFNFIHLSGCHDPYKIDENGNSVDGTTPVNVVSATKGCFLLIREYISQMKKAGVYEDATIIITGDHCRARNDGAKPEQPRQTALFVKERGQSGALKYSDAQVSQKNFLAEIVKSAGIVTTHDYGSAYSDVPVSINQKRYHKFQLSKGDGTTSIVTYEVSGRGDDFANWKIYKEENIGKLYK